MEYFPTSGQKCEIVSKTNIFVSNAVLVAIPLAMRLASREGSSEFDHKSESNHNDGLSKFQCSDLFWKETCRTTHCDYKPSGSPWARKREAMRAEKGLPMVIILLCLVDFS